MNILFVQSFTLSFAPKVVLLCIWWMNWSTDWKAFTAVTLTTDIQDRCCGFNWEHCINCHLGRYSVHTFIWPLCCFFFPFFFRPLIILFVTVCVLRFRSVKSFRLYSLFGSYSSFGPCSFFGLLIIVTVCELRFCFFSLVCLQVMLGRMQHAFSRFFKVYNEQRQYGNNTVSWFHSFY